MSVPTVSREYPCNECSAGIMHLDFITYFTWLGDELITVPNFPAWICDVCGRREYDQKARVWLTALLNPETGKNSNNKMPVRPVVLKQPPVRPTPD
jgi:YgiT-type zinc finger domain-containing protein